MIKKVIRLITKKSHRTNAYEAQFKCLWVKNSAFMYIKNIKIANDILIEAQYLLEDVKYLQFSDKKIAA